MNQIEKTPEVRLYTLSIDQAEYCLINPPYSVEDMVIDEVASHLYRLRYVARVDMRRTAPGAITQSLCTRERKTR